jgi:hypothetical protein
MYFNYKIHSFLLLVNFFSLNCQLRPLDFDRILPNNHMGHLLKITVQIYHDLPDLELQNAFKLEAVINKLIDLIGAIYIFRFHESGLQIWQQDLIYLLDLIYTMRLRFIDLRSNNDNDKVIFADQLFLQVENLLLTMIHK